ncbi:GDP dissociation inhibitor-domain-containing protein [Cladochytrium replicatum]|nr:GDP dissociation inhibitor-domain-containing protein [Cladochytrium replicatum]
MALQDSTPARPVEGAVVSHAAATPSEDDRSDEPQHLLPSSFDVIVIGTGLTESITSAALSRAGLSVLHLDSQPFYGGHGTTLRLDQLLEFAAGQSQSLGYSDFTFAVHDIFPPNQTYTLEEIAQLRTDLLEELARIPEPEKRLLSSIAPPPDTSDDLGAIVKLHTILDLWKSRKGWNVELEPAMLLSGGELVDLLISSAVGKYVEFKALEGMFLFWEGGLQKVPCSKDDVFSDASISLMEKRKLMKLLSSALAVSEEESDASLNQPSFSQYLESQGLSPRFRAAILYAIAMVPDGQDVSTDEGLRLTQRHLKSLGRFAKTSFLSPLYGAYSELTQSFCRSSAVFGGTFMLDHHISQVGQDTETSEWKVTCQPNEGDGSIPQNTFTATHVFSSTDYADKFDGVGSERDVLEMSHAIVVLDSPVVLTQLSTSTPASTEADDEEAATARPDDPVVRTPSLLFVPPKEGSSAIYGMLQGVETAATPVGKYVLYLYTRHQTSPESDLRPSILELLQSRPSSSSGEPKSLLTVYYKRTVRVPKSVPSEGVRFVHDPIRPLDIDECVQVAKTLFNKVVGTGDSALQWFPTTEGGGWDEDE